MSKTLTHDSYRIQIALEKSGLVEGLSGERIADIGQIARLIKFETDEYIIVEDSSQRDLYVISEGMVSVRTVLPTIKFKESVTAFLSDYEIFGEFAFADGKNRSSSIRADQPTVVLKLDYVSLLELMEIKPEIGFRLMLNLSALISKRLREVHKFLQKYIVSLQVKEAGDKHHTDLGNPFR